MLPFFNSILSPVKNHLKYFIALTLFALPCSGIVAQALPVVKKALSFSYDQLQLPSGEGMGLLGGNYLFSIPDKLYSGLGIYGAIEGERGGFFVGGLAIGYRQALYKNYFFDVNAFVGGGGGGGAPQGGGLMLRTSFEAGVNVRQNSFGLGYSYIEFPNGNINSQQISVNYRHFFESYHFSGWPLSSGDNIKWLNELRQHAKHSASQFSLQLTRYFPKDSLARSGKRFDKQLDILGIRWRNKIKNNLWFEFETGGAMLGNIDGYAQVFAGLSYEYYFTPEIYGHVGFLVGAAGGGDVNTDGGLMYRPFSGLGYRFNPDWSVSSQIAWTAALEDNFKATTLLFNIVYHYRDLIPSLVTNSHEVLSLGKNISWQRYRIRPGVQRYSHYRGSGRKSPGQRNIDVNLLNLKLDGFVTSRLYVTGQAIGAFSGEAGGYAVGLVGPGYQATPYVSAELLLGVAGGGGIAVGSGQIVQPMLNLHYPLNSRWELEASLGYIHSVNDKLSALVTNFALGYRFRSPVE